MSDQLTRAQQIRLAALVHSIKLYEPMLNDADFESDILVTAEEIEAWIWKADTKYGLPAFYAQLSKQVKP